MQITVLTIGSRGDVQPYIALAQGLQQAGHQVRLCAPENFKDLVEGYGVSFAPMTGDVHRVMQSAAGLQAMESRDLIGFFRRLFDEMMPLAEQITKDVFAAIEGADLIVTSALTLFAAEAIQEKWGIPFIAAYPQPLLPTTAFPSIAAPMIPAWLGPLEKLYNWWSARLLLVIFNELIRTPVDRIRLKMMGLPRRKRWASLSPIWNGHQAVLYGISPRVIPPMQDLPPTVHVTGYWIAQDAPWQHPASLEAFLQAGPPPVYIGFGSMTDRDPTALTRLCIDALNATGQRGILLSGWGGLGAAELPPSIYLLEHAPHEWLFPKMAAVVHHGGAGTTAASLRAGVPTVIIPFIADQPFFGEQVRRIGAGPAPIPRRRLTLPALTEAIRQATTDVPMRERAARLGEALRAEQGVTNAVQLIERYSAVALRAAKPYGLKTGGRDRADYATP